MLNKSLRSLALGITLTTGLSVTSANESSEAVFDLVDTHLETGGVVYAIVNVDGDIRNISNQLSELLLVLRESNPELSQMPPIPIGSIMESFGLSAVRAVGLSSKERGPGFHNRTFILLEDSPQGLLSLYGDQNRPFQVLDFAPASTDVASEYTLNTQVLTDIARRLAVTFMGENGNQMVDVYLNRNIPETTFTAGEIISALEGRVGFIAEIDDSRSFTVPEFGEFPWIDFIIRLESAGSSITKIEELLAKAELSGFSRESDGDVIRLQGSIKGFPDYTFLISGNQKTGEFFLSSSKEYHNSCLAAKGSRLGNSESFKAANSGLPAEGITLSYMSPDMQILVDTYVSRIIEKEGDNAETMRPFMEWSLGNIMAEFPVATVAEVQTNGIFVQSNWHSSHKRNLATLAYANPVTIGLMAAMAIPAFQKVRETSQQKAITNNLRMLAAAAQQYMLEEGVTSVETELLVGPDAYIWELNPIAGETYPEVIDVEMTEIEAILPDGTVITYRF